MALLDKLTDLGKSVAQKSGEIAESSKLSMSIKKKEKEIRLFQLEIGKYVYEQYKNEQAFDEKIIGICASIDGAYEEIVKLEEERQSIGLGDLDIEVVDAEPVDDEELVITEEDEEFMKNL